MEKSYAPTAKPACRQAGHCIHVLIGFLVLGGGLFARPLYAEELLSASLFIFFGYKAANI